jgi:hypothetical protein
MNPPQVSLEVICLFGCFSKGLVAERVVRTENSVIYELILCKTRQIKEISLISSHEIDVGRGNKQTNK